ncbi:OTU domain-containing protein 3-like [Tachysurus fulvidraco]|uniref:OTU domain-containing protein 3-like n=1 Tax=Tachysurus fulvidraco TaxID=1234273 RepID=UPI001FEEF195|nr:OTU domain-containing protein 3-like [Tachysurus fulvidraco]XP_027026298.2 OTU domain-containing protein 3-like [Tachysurus fulvidraco]
MSRKQSGKSVRGNRKCELERKRGERAARRALAKDRKNRPPGEDEGEEFVSFSNQLKALGLKLREVPGDGNCLFRALADQLEGHSRNHLRLRHETVQYMQSHRQDFEPFVEDDVPFTKHVSDLAEPGTFAGNDAIVAFARSQQVKVVIHQLNAALWEINGSEKPLCQELHIAYCYGDHYDSVRHLADNSESPAHLRIANLNNSRRFGDGEKGKQKAPSPSHSPSDDEDVILNSLKTTSMNNQEINPCQSSATSQKCHAEWLEAESSIQSSPGDIGKRIHPENQRDTVCPPETGTTHKPKLSNKQRKEQHRLEKKKKQEERHRQKVLQGKSSHHQDQNLLGPVTLVPALSTLSI